MIEKIKKFIYSDEDYEYVDQEDNRIADDRPRQQKLSKLKITDAEVVVCEPLSYSEAQSIADYIIANRSIIINLHKITPDQAKRIIDFLSGTVYSLNGTIQKVGDEIFLLAPNEVNVTGTVENDDDELS